MCYDKLKYDLKMSIKNITLSRAEIIEKIDFQLNLTKNFNFSQKPSYTPYHATISRWELFPLFMNHIVSLYRNSSDFRFQKGPKIKVQHNFCDSFDFQLLIFWWQWMKISKNLHFCHRSVTNRLYGVQRRWSHFKSERIDRFWRLICFGSKYIFDIFKKNSNIREKSSHLNGKF